MPSYSRILAVLLTSAACVAAQSSDATPQTKCLGDCFASVLEKTPSPAGCASVTTAKDIEDCVCKSTTFASDVGYCLGTTCPDLANDIANGVGSFCSANTPSTGGSSGSSGGKPASGSGSDSGAGLLTGKGGAAALEAPVVAGPRKAGSEVTSKIPIRSLPYTRFIASEAYTERMSPR